MLCGRLLINFATVSLSCFIGATGSLLATGKSVSEEVALELAFCLTKIKLVVKVTTAKPKTSRKSFPLS